MRVEFRGAALTMLSATALAATMVSCSASPAPAAPTATPPPNSPSASPAPDPDQRICRSYAAAAPSARTPLDAMRTQAVLVPFIDYIELGTHEIAAAANDSHSPAVAQAMREIVLAQEDIDDQGHRALPPGADLGETPVRLDPTRLSAALDAADRVCAPILTR